MGNPFAIALAYRLGLVLTNDSHGRIAETRAARRAAERGELVRITRGVYMRAPEWRAADADARFRVRVVGIASTLSPDAVFSHRTAASILGLPVLGSWPTRLDVVIPTASYGGRSSANVVAHAGELRGSDVIEKAGFLLTTPARTVADIARTSSFASGVAVADAALHRKRRPRPLVTMEELRDESARGRSSKGRARLAKAVGFASPLSDSVRESESRVLIHELGFPPPELQRPWSDASGRIGDSDFWWPEYRHVGEYDGRVKYTKPEFLAGRTPSQVVVDEKIREDRIRALGMKVTRWVTDDLDDCSRLMKLLLDAGLPVVRRPTRPVPRSASRAA